MKLKKGALGKVILAPWHILKKKGDRMDADLTPEEPKFGECGCKKKKKKNIEHTVEDTEEAESLLVRKMKMTKENRRRQKMRVKPI